MKRTNTEWFHFYVEYEEDMPIKVEQCLSGANGGGNGEIEVYEVKRYQILFDKRNNFKASIV